MRAIVLAAVLATSEPGLARPKPKLDDDERPGAERNRFTDAELEEMFGDMAPGADAPPPKVELPEVDFIRWDPDAAEPAPPADVTLAA